MANTLTPEQTAHRKKVAANLGLASAGFGLLALGSKGAASGLRAAGKLRKMPHLNRIANKVEHHTSNALIVGTGVGSVGALNGASINRSEANKEKNRIAAAKKSKFGKGLVGNYTQVTAAVNPVIGTKHNTTSGVPKVRSTVKGTLRNVSAGRAPQITSGIPGSKKVLQVANAVDVNKGFGAGFKTGAKVADRMHPMPGRFNPRHGAKATEVAGQKTGAAVHDFKAGYSRKVYDKSVHAAGKVTTRQNAVYPVAHQAGNLTRRFGTPAVVLGGSYVAGRKVGHKVAKASCGPNCAHAGAVIRSIAQQKDGGAGIRSAMDAGHSHAQIKGWMNRGWAAKKAHADVSKADRRFAPGTGSSFQGPGKHSVGYLKMKSASANPTALPKAAAVRNGLRATKLAKSYGYDPERNRNLRNGAYAGTAAAGSIGLGAVAIHQGAKATPHISANKSKVTGKLTSLNVGRKALRHGGRAVTAGTAAVALASTAHKINNKSRQGNWRSYN